MSATSGSCDLVAPATRIRKPRRAIPYQHELALFDSSILPCSLSLNALVQTQRLHMHPPVITYPDHSFTQQIHSVRYSWSGQTNLGQTCHHQPQKKWQLLEHSTSLWLPSVMLYASLLSLSLTLSVYIMSCPGGPIQHELWNFLYAMAIINSWRMQGIFGPASESEHTTTVSADPS